MDLDKLERTVLESVLTITKYMKRSRSYSEQRKSDNRILYIQEPVGYEFYTFSNINRISDRLPMKPRLNFADLSPIMDKIFYAHGTSEVNGGLTYREKSKVVQKVRWMNDEVVREASKTYATRRLTDKSYESLLTNPNEISRRPAYPSVHGVRTVPNVYYHEHPSKQLTPYQPSAYREGITSSGFHIPQLFEL